MKEKLILVANYTGYDRNNKTSCFKFKGVLEGKKIKEAKLFTKYTRFFEKRKEYVCEITNVIVTGNILFADLLRHKLTSEVGSTSKGVEEIFGKPDIIDITKDS